ncbi:hypothetical protein OIU77_026735 [Salix suchowensis]|uniref:DNA primase large subunit C-terminal domain-containing protein n=1 Tax=Salix suchowensis TaxID=1278906 RepID=A0ABQ9BQD3_9ROSI|nr:hypothetical protein OIU77_026735 [Salix suchowensis]
MEIVKPKLKKPPTSANDAASTLPLYCSAPSLEVRLEDFELYAIDRLRVLKGISDGLSRGKQPEEMEKLVDNLWKAHMGHPLRSEIQIFGRLSHEAQRLLMAELDLPYKPVTTAEFEGVKEKLHLVARSIGQPKLTESDAIFYKVPFEEVPELVAGRRVFIYKGYAYVAMNQVVSLVATQFRGLLSKALVLTNRKWTSTIREQEKDRLTPIVEALCTSYLGPDYSQPKEFAELREDHHLKHGGRMQLGLFLKGVGLKLDDALAFWKAEFSQKVGAERFDKEYAYSIRHNYGREGKRTDYTPYSCQKIISSTPGVGDHHGCPYRHFSEENLKAALSKMGVNSGALENVMDKVRNRHYQLACTLTFESIHGSSNDAGINHPNQYFSDSHEIFKSKNNPSGQGEALGDR